MVLSFWAKWEWTRLRKYGLGVKVAWVYNESGWYGWDWIELNRFVMNNSTIEHGNGMSIKHRIGMDNFGLDRIG